MCNALHYLLDNIFIRFGSKLYRQSVDIPMGTNCAPLVEDLFLFCYEIYLTKLQLSKANSFDTEAPFLDLDVSITNGKVSSKIYDKRDDFNFEIVNFPFLSGILAPLPMVYIFHSLFVLRECVLMLMTSTTETYF